jgi:hypothetical protein
LKLKNTRLSLLLIASLWLAVLPRPAAAHPSVNATLDTLTEGQVINGFRAQTLYLNDSDQPFGARLIHVNSGFTVDLLQIQSVPQVFVWVNSVPVSDRGEPHTQEHLLLGKGNVGRAHSSLESMSLVESSAFTEQLRTCYDFHTAAGPEVFYKLFESQMNALLHPDYTDDEIRREVSNWGINIDPASKRLSLEEKGTVYQEMVTTYDHPDDLLYRAAARLIFGDNHPLALSSGGWPDAIRQMKPADIRKFHNDNYHLGNMGVVASFSEEMPFADTLKRLDEILNRLEPKQEQRHFLGETDFPAPKPAPAGRIQLVEYPEKNAQKPVQLLFVWPAQLKLDRREKNYLELFLSTIAGDATTNLYKMFVDSKTRVIETGAQGVSSLFDANVEDGNPIYIGLSDADSAKMTAQNIGLIRQKIIGEIKRIASLPDESPGLKELNERAKSRVIQDRRDLSKFVNSPPGFGFRDTGSSWMTHLARLNRSPGFRKSVTLKDELAAIQETLSQGKNIWRDLIARWRLTDTIPYAVAAKPSPRLITRIDQQRNARIQQETLELRKKYHAVTQLQALRRYKAEYDATTAKLERLATASPSMRFLDHPPLTLDEQLDYKIKPLPNGVQMVASYFDNMTSATTGLALRLDGVPEEQLVYLSALPELLTQSGVIKDGKPISFEEMSEMIRNQILSLSSDFSSNFQTGRAELLLTGAGNDAAEAQRALEWMKLVLNNPDWRSENLPRLRDVIDQTLSDLRNRTQDAEETWVSDPPSAYRRQDNPLLLSTESFLTKAHNVHRLRWLLKDAGSKETRDAISPFLESLAAAGAKGKREDLETLVAVLQNKKGSLIAPGLRPFANAYPRLPQEAKTIASEAARDLEQLLPDIPDVTLAKDWAYLCREMLADLLVPPTAALNQLNAVRQSLLKTGGARMFMIGAHSTVAELDERVSDLLSVLERAAVEPAKYSNERRIDARVRERVGEKANPVFVGLVNPNSEGGVFLNSAPLAGYKDGDNREKLLDYLAACLYAGGGAHGIFIKTWGAGLAYSNGFGIAPEIGRIDYYAERTPELPQTLRFVIDELKKAKPDPGLVEYAVAVAFSEFRSASTYEERGEAIANDLADGNTPERVQHFREGLLVLRQTPNLSDELFRRMSSVYARVLPGFGTRARDVQGGVFYVIGPEKQLAAYEQYLKTVEGPEAQLYRIYPRDYWITLRIDSLDH